MPSTTPDTTAKTASEAPIDDLSFEAALKELERIVGRLESGDATLDESIRLYERGDRLRARCAERAGRQEAREGQISRRSVAQRDNSYRLDIWVLRSTEDTWVSTVLIEMNSCDAISL